MTQELKPCPFCGGSNLEVVNTPQGCFIGCSCGCFTGDFETEAEAIDAWNTRAERTCCDDNYGGMFVCSECGANVRDTYIGRSYIDKFGKRWYGTSHEHHFNYCPNCGARVVDE